MARCAPLQAGVQLAFIESSEKEVRDEREGGQMKIVKIAQHMRTSCHKLAGTAHTYTPHQECDVLCICMSCMPLLPCHAKCPLLHQPRSGLCPSSCIALRPPLQKSMQRLNTFMCPACALSCAPSQMHAVISSLCGIRAACRIHSFAPHASSSCGCTNSAAWGTSPREERDSSASDAPNVLQAKDAWTPRRLHGGRCSL